MKTQTIPSKSWLQLQRFQEQEVLRLKHIQKEQENLFYTPPKSKSPNKHPTNIHDRQIDEVREKWKRIEQQKEIQHLKQFQNEMKGVTFHPQILQQSKQLNKGRMRTPDQYYQDALKYKIEKQQQTEQLKQQMQEAEKQKTPFTPTTNNKSAQMVQMDFYERLEDKRLNKQQKLLEIQKHITPSFKPQLNNIRYKTPQRVNVMPISPQSKSPCKRNQSQFDALANCFKSFEFFEETRKQYSTVQNDQIKQQEFMNKQIILLSQQLNENAKRQVSPIVSRDTTPKRTLAYRPIIDKVATKGKYDLKKTPTQSPTPLKQQERLTTTQQSEFDQSIDKAQKHSGQKNYFTLINSINDSDQKVKQSRMGSMENALM